ncbi:unnamed protein product [Boreogadus saida]
MPHPVQKDGCSCGVIVVEMARAVMEAFPQLPQMQFETTRKAMGESRRNMGLQVLEASVFDEETCSMCGADRPPGEAPANTDWEPPSFFSARWNTSTNPDLAFAVCRSNDPKPERRVLDRKARKHDWHILHDTTETAAPLSRLKSRHPYNKAAQELLRSTTEDLSKDGWLAAAWKQEWERAGPTQIHHYILDPGDGATGDLLPRRQWTLLNRLRTGVVQMEKWNGTSLDINATIRGLGDRCQGLLGMHALSGCDTASYPCGKGKTSALKVLLGKNIPGLNTVLGEPDATHSDLKDTGTEFFIALYGQKKAKSMNNTRY